MKKKGRQEQMEVLLLESLLIMSALPAEAAI